MLKNPACLDPKPENLYFPPKKNDYVYFEDLPFQTTPGIHLTNLAVAADASMFAYARYGQTRMSEGEFKQILRDAGLTITETIGDCFVDNAPTARGFFAGNDDFAILAFRGTEQDNRRDTEADLDALLVLEEPLGGRSAGQVNQGFQRYLRSVWPSVAKLVSDYRVGHKSQEICITGHNLGAAIATLAFHQIQDDHTSLYTFGSPRVGNQAFCDAVSALGQTHPCCRTVNLEDVVTHIPPTGILGYQHLNCTVFWIDRDHKVQQNPSTLSSDMNASQLMTNFYMGRVGYPLPGPLADHSPVRYCHWIALEAGYSAASPVELLTTLTGGDSTSQPRGRRPASKTPRRKRSVSQAMDEGERIPAPADDSAAVVESVSRASITEGVPFHADDPATVDALHRRPFAEVVGKRIQQVWETHENPGGAFMFHIHGPWGSGKTSVLNFLREYLQSEECPSAWIVVDFNAWQHQHIQPCWWTLIKEVYRQALQQTHVSRSALLRVRWLMWRVRADLLPILATLALVSTFVLVATGKLDFLLNGGTVTSTTPGDASKKLADQVILWVKDPCRGVRCRGRCVHV